jgi:DNA-directed RNA polymerase omega subunit
MKVYTPGDVTRHTGSKYLGVLVAAKYARQMNEFRRGHMLEDPEISGQREKLTTTALEFVAHGDLQFHLVDRKRPVDL